MEAAHSEAGGPESARVSAARSALATLLDLAQRTQHEYRPCIEAPAYRSELAALAVEVALAADMAADPASFPGVLALGLDDLLATAARLQLRLLRSAARTHAAGQAYLDACSGVTPRAVRHGAIVAGTHATALHAAAPPALPATARAALVLLAHGGNAALESTLGGPIAAGTCPVGIAALESDSGYDFDNLRTRMQRSGGASAIIGSKSLVEDGATAEFLFVSMRVLETVSGDGPDDDGRSLYCIEADRPGVTRTVRSGIDGAGYADFHFERVEVREIDRVGPRGESTALLVHGIDAGCVALCEEAVGLMGGLVGGVARAHDAGDGKARARLARLLVHLGRARAATRIASAGLSASDVTTRLRAVSLGKHVVGVAARFVGEHAARGEADEASAVRTTFARLAAIDLTWGDAEHHLERYASLLTR